MHYAFPVIRTIDDVLPAIAGADEFIVKRAPDSGLQIVNYLFASATTFPDPLEAEDAELARLAAIRRECRGITFDLETGEIVTRKLGKFFNFLEKPETQLDRIDFSRPHVILEKLDGSLITFFRHKNGSFECHTKMGRTDVALPVEKFVAASSIPYEAFFDAMRAEGKTIMFEWTARIQRIVLDYPEDALTLLAMRDNVTGEFTPYSDMATLAGSFGIPVVRALPGSVENIQKFMAETRAAEGIEGYIIRFDDGHMLKIKSEWYVSIHSTKDELARERNVWDIILNERLDDLKPFMDPTDRAAIEAFAEAFDLAIERYAHNLSARVEEARSRLGVDKKAFAISIAGEKHDKGMMFSIWDGKNAVEVVLNHLKKNIGTQPKVDAVRNIVGGLCWDRYYKSVDLDA